MFLIVSWENSGFYSLTGNCKKRVLVYVNVWSLSIATKIITPRLESTRTVDKFQRNIVFAINWKMERNDQNDENLKQEREERMRSLKRKAESKTKRDFRRLPLV